MPFGSPLAESTPRGDGRRRARRRAYAHVLLIDSQPILTFHGDTLDDASAMLREQIDALPLTARITSLTSGCDDGTFSGMAIVDLIPEVESAEPGPALQENVTELRVEDGLPDEI